MTIPRKRARGKDRLSKRVSVSFKEDELPDIKKSAKKENLRTAEYIRKVMLNLEDIPVGKGKQSKDSVYTYDGAIKVLEQTFQQIIKQLDNRKGKPKKVTILIEKDGKGRVIIDIPELNFHLNFKQVGI